MKRIVVATNNEHKILEINRQLEPLGWECVTLSSCGDFPEPVEDADSFKGNALIKARAAHQNTGMPALADDSGLCIEALNGAPGIYSSRYAGAGCSSIECVEKVLHELKDVEDGKRGAHFNCTLAYIDENDNEFFVEGRCEGHIAHSPRGENGFGYDPIFVPDASPTGTIAEQSDEVKDSLSARGNALRVFVKKMSQD